ncbi:PRC-barrel domain-containing protein [Halalkalibacter suaedae]|uniref:PRC-barrel domain-containing protein n=1 Tax=Halalkalibacter suaedae TaxID=2822140 RepID=A0A940WW09_9BACI|nr:PRC-barrel domain-containing protein [Bacillus suaedae]MBP3951378.1 PRC-barrel domain-containing protein [Bacillus suaedae]
MRTFSTVEGLPVLSRASGEECGHMIDLIYLNGHVSGFMVDPKGLLTRHLFLPVENVLSFGDDGIMIKSSSELKPYVKDKQAFLLRHGKRRLQGTALLTKEGEKLGLLEDVYFHEELGRIVGYEVTEGLVADLIEGRRVVNSQANLTIAGGRAILTE